ncbi:MAG TPA: GNAT family N-acetyltransferase [Pyrinomonadaceae bacterium]|nr:GNAT family N-acetyltransferase [Pyrinomonadaceae bacterium]
MLSVPKTSPRWPTTSISEVCRLDNNHQDEVLQFLGTRPLHTFIMSSWIRDNGLESPFNRGSFFGSRTQKGTLEGVALIGHITLFETESNQALGNFARLTRECPDAHTVLGRAERVDRFLDYYARGPVQPRLVCYELLFQKKAVANVEGRAPLRQAVADDLEMIVPTHALTAFEESGVNPLAKDPERFHERCARRVEQGRVWVVTDNHKLKFKADVVSETPDVVYLEGVYVSPDHRGNGYGAQCLAQLTNQLLDRTKSVCLLVNQANAAAQACYKKAGFEFREYYDTLYLQQTEANDEEEEEQ